MTKVAAVQEYTAESELRRPLRLLRAMGRDLMASRELAWRLFVRDLSTQYRQTALGYAWAFLPPIVTTAIWVFLNDQQVISVETPDMPYPLFVLIGSLLWQCFVEALNSPLKAVGGSKQLLAKINFPREALILAGLGEVLVNLAIRVCLLALMLLWFRQPLPLTAVLAPLGVVVIINLGLVIGILLTPIAVLYGDVARIVTLVTGVWFFLTPVVYAVPQSGAAKILIEANPVTPLLVTTRDWLTLGQSHYLPAFAAVAAVSAVLVLVGWLLYRLAMPHVIARIGS